MTSPSCSKTCRAAATRVQALERNGAMPAAAMPPQSGTRTAVVHVRVGRCDIAIALDQVRQALPLPAQGLAALPRRSGALLGVADVDGAAVPIVALERWLPLEHTAEPAALQRLLVLQHDSAQVGLRVDAVLGVKAVAPADIRRLHHTPDDNELFESVVPASAGTPTLCLLEVARLMHLSQAWCEAADLAPAARTQAPAGAERPDTRTRRYALLQIGPEQWAVPVEAVERVLPLPPPELALGGSERSWAIAQWQGRKLPLVDISAGRQASDRQNTPWMVLLAQGPLVLGLTVSACLQVVDVAQAALAPAPGDALRTGVVLLPGQGACQVLDVAKLFAATPEASISRRQPTAAPAPTAAEATEPLPYLVFSTDQRYASPVEGIAGVVPLPGAVQEDLRQGRRAVLAWRGQTVPVVNLPAIGKATASAQPLLAVLVQTPGSTAPPLGIAIHSLIDWLPAHSVRRSGMRLGAMGEFGLINACGAVEHANLVVLDLAQMAYLLG